MTEDEIRAVVRATIGLVGLNRGWFNRDDAVRMACELKKDHDRIVSIAVDQAEIPPFERR